MANPRGQSAEHKGCQAVHALRVTTDATVNAKEEVAIQNSHSGAAEFPITPNGRPISAEELRSGTGFHCGQRVVVYLVVGHRRTVLSRAVPRCPGAGDDSAVAEIHIRGESFHHARHTLLGRPGPRVLRAVAATVMRMLGIRALADFMIGIR